MFLTLLDPALLSVLTVLGALSPLLSATYLFQLKEWRFDRLFEHLRRDGWWVSLVGRSRLILIGSYTAFIVISTAAIILTTSKGEPVFFVHLWELVTMVGWLALFVAVSILTIALKKQKKPVWTQKAILLFLTALSLTIIITLFCIAYIYTLALPYLIVLQPLFLAVSHILWKPVDVILKKRVMDQAIRLRSQMDDVTVIGIAGSVGKTTVKELIAHLLQDLKPLVTPAHVNTEMGVAQWLTNKATSLRPPASSIFVIEMGAYRKGEIALLCRIAQPIIGVMTALGSDHLALFGSEQNIIDANGELIEALPKDGHAFFYGDNKGCDELAKHSPCAVTIAKPDAELAHPLQGRHNDYNVSLAVAVAKHLGVKDNRIAELLETFTPQAHTFSVKIENGVMMLDDTYNISPLSLGAALDWAAKQKERPRVLLTSGLQETGIDEDRYLSELGSKAAKSVERVVFTDKHGADIFAKAFGKPVEVLGDKTQHVDAGSTLLAVGRMPLSTVNRLLPHVEDMRLS